MRVESTPHEKRHAYGHIAHQTFRHGALEEFLKLGIEVLVIDVHLPGERFPIFTYRRFWMLLAKVNGEHPSCWQLIDVAKERFWEEEQLDKSNSHIGLFRQFPDVLRDVAATP
jgi:hypothetical protein